MITLPQASGLAATETRPVRMAVVGANFGAGIARHLHQGNHFAQVSAVCDADGARADALGAELGVPAHHCLEAVLADPAVEAVALFTPPIARAKLIARILAAGRHVITTKPFETDLAAAADVLDDAQRRGLAVHMNSPAPVPAADIAQIKAWEDEYRLGTPIAMRAATWANYRERPTGSWYDDPEHCPAAPILRLGVYFLNDFAALLGTPTRVFVSQSRIFTARPTADNAQLSIEFESGALASVFASFCVDDGRPWSDEVTINYERGTIRRRVERTGARDMSGDHAVLELQRPGADVVSFHTPPGGFAGWYDWKTFHDAVRGLNDAPLQNAAEVLYGIRLLDAMRRSAVGGRPEAV